ncbi:MAG: hypothetical protein HYZ34_04190 [Ignavibacteriae bacterium]|nr:hypothetical protein [Ignavibacteriota bacterium]
MAIVIDALKSVREKKRLPTEAFFVDTNIVIAYKDPFGRSLDSKYATENEQVTEVVRRLKSFSLISFSTISVALEYFKHIQVGFFYKMHTGEKINYTTEQFKKLRESNIEFMNGWDLQLKLFNKLFVKVFPPYQLGIPIENLIQNFRGSQVDFGDHLLFSVMMSCKPEQHCVFSNDSDFYSFEENFYLLTTNKRIIEQASKEEKLLSV